MLPTWECDVENTVNIISIQHMYMYMYICCMYVRDFLCYGLQVPPASTSQESVKAELPAACIGQKRTHPDAELQADLVNT